MFLANVVFSCNIFQQLLAPMFVYRYNCNQSYRKILQLNISTNIWTNVKYNCSYRLKAFKFTTIPQCNNGFVQGKKRYKFIDNAGTYEYYALTKKDFYDETWISNQTERMYENDSS